MGVTNYKNTVEILLLKFETFTEKVVLSLLK